MQVTQVILNFLDATLKKMKRSRKISFHIFYLTPVHSRSLYVGWASFDICSSHSGPLALELENTLPLLLRKLTTPERLQPNVDPLVVYSVPVPANPQGTCLMEELTAWALETWLFPLEGAASLWTSAVTARCLLPGRVLRTIVESDSTVRPLTKSSSTTVFFYLLKWIHIFFFSNSRGTLIFLNRILNRNPIYEKDK